MTTSFFIHCRQTLEQDWAGSSVTESICSMVPFFSSLYWFNPQDRDFVNRSFQLGLISSAVSYTSVLFTHQSLHGPPPLHAQYICLWWHIYKYPNHILFPKWSTWSGRLEKKWMDVYYIFCPQCSIITWLLLFDALAAELNSHTVTHTS